MNIATKFSLFQNKRSHAVLARYPLSSFTSLESDPLPWLPLFLKIARKIPDPVPKFHGFVDLTPVAITHASLNYRGVSLYFGCRREIFLTHTNYTGEKGRTRVRWRERMGETLQWKFRASRISFSTLCVCLSSFTFTMKRPAVLS